MQNQWKLLTWTLDISRPLLALLVGQLTGSFQDLLIASHGVFITIRTVMYCCSNIRNFFWHFSELRTIVCAVFFFFFCCSSISVFSQISDLEHLFSSSKMSNSLITWISITMTTRKMPMKNHLLLGAVLEEISHAVKLCIALRLFFVFHFL